jgi:hypothetical protein
MRRILALAALAAILSSTPAIALPGEPWRANECRYEHLNERSGFTTFEVKTTIRCAIGHWSVPGGLSTAFCYAEHESGFNEDADNPTSTAAGVYQTVDGTWDTIRSAHPALRRGWGLGGGVHQGRTHVVLVLRYVAAHGWGAWSNWAAYSC